MELLKSIVFYICFIYSQATINGCGDRLFLTPFIKNGSVAMARTLSKVEPEHFYGLKSHSAFITVKEDYGSNLFFWYFPHPKQSEKRAWIIWLQGGPGWTSLKGLFDIMGPLQVIDDELTLRNITWASDYSLLFVDNPVGVGYSFTNDDRGYTSDEDTVGEQLYEFLQQFLEVFPELRKAPLFLIGESYAGKYVPALGIQIHRHKNPDKPINFVGSAVGNGLIDPRSMMHYSDLCREIGILEGKYLDTVKELEEDVVALIDEKRIVDASNKFNETIEYIKKYSGVSIYNYLKDPDSGAPEFEAYVQRPDVRSLIHVGDASFDFNNQLVYQKMLGDIMNTTKPYLEELLEHYWFLSYTGQLDVILAYSLAKHMYADLHWSGRDSYLQSQRIRVRSYAHGGIVAYKRSGGKFVEILIRGAGHMVPVEQPKVAKFIIDSYIREVVKKSHQDC